MSSCVDAAFKNLTALLSTMIISVALCRRAKKYKLKSNFLSRQEFFLIMQNLPEHVPDTEIHEMFSIADVDKDGQISYEEFMVLFIIVKLMSLFLYRR